jgi:dephospho-CoA kinase
MSKIIIGLVGPLASGKEVVKKYIEENYQAKSYKFSNSLRDILNRIYIPITRENLQNLSLNLRNLFGQDLLAKIITQDAQNDKHDIVIIDGARRLSDISHLQKLDNFKLISIDADLEIRYKRMCERNENEGDNKKTFTEFLEDNNREAEKEIPQVMAAAHFHIDNNQDFNNLYKQINEIMTKIK